MRALLSPPLSPNHLPITKEICICRPRSTAAVAVPSRLPSCCRRMRIVAASARRPPTSTSGEDDNQPADSSSVLSEDEVEQTGMAMVERLITTKDGFRIFLAVLFWISLFFWASVWNDRDGTKPNRGFWFRK